MNTSILPVSALRWVEHDPTFASLMLGRIELAQISKGQGSEHWFYTLRFPLAGERACYSTGNEADAKAVAEAHARKVLPMSAANDADVFYVDKSPDDGGESAQSRGHALRQLLDHPALRDETKVLLRRDLGLEAPRATRSSDVAKGWDMAVEWLRRRADSHAGRWAMMQPREALKATVEEMCTIHIDSAPRASGKAHATTRLDPSRHE